MILGTNWSTGTAALSSKAETFVIANDGDLQLLGKNNDRIWHSGTKMISANGKSINIILESLIYKSVMKSKK